MQSSIREMSNASRVKRSEIGECDDKNVVTHQKVAFLELNNYVLTRLVIMDVVVMKVDTGLTCFTELVSS
jgi:hypothetical protein